MKTEGEYIFMKDYDSRTYSINDFVEWDVRHYPICLLVQEMILNL